MNAFLLNNHFFSLFLLLWAKCFSSLNLIGFGLHPHLNNRGQERVGGAKTFDCIIWRRAGMRGVSGSFRIKIQLKERSDFQCFNKPTKMEQHQQKKCIKIRFQLVVVVRWCLFTQNRRTPINVGNDRRPWWGSRSLLQTRELCECEFGNGKTATKNP